MIDSLKKEECTGCGVCVDVCPVHAISMNLDSEGFGYPVIDKDVCTQCNLCEKTCPVLHIDWLKKNDFHEPLCYGGYSKNLEQRFESTSGGAFSALAMQMYKEGGYVGGAVYDELYFIHHYISNDKKDLTRLRSSKYAQSDAVGFYKKVKDLLNEGNKVLVCGTPCQMAGLRSFLRKDYESLIIIDFICLSISSPKVQRLYLDHIEKEQKASVIDLKYKAKDIGWHTLSKRIRLANGKTIYTSRGNDLLSNIFHSHLSARPCCFDCKFKGFPRMADLTLADFWGVDKLKPHLDNNCGTSAVLLNSEKGKSFFEKAAHRMILEEVSVKDLLPGNPALVHSLSRPPEREEFMRCLDTEPFDKLVERILPVASGGLKKFIVQSVRNLRNFFITTTLHPVPVYQFIRYNFLSSNIKTSWRRGALIFPCRYCVIRIHKKAKINLDGHIILGEKRVKGSKLETRFLMDANSYLYVKTRFRIMYGGDVEVFENAQLIVDWCGGNINNSIICGHKIEFGYQVALGRDVRIRDNNGTHQIALEGYKQSHPVKIGTHVWLCSGAEIMPGSSIQDGAIVGANSVVSGKVKAHTLVSGSPAKLIEENIYWNL